MVSESGRSPETDDQHRAVRRIVGDDREWHVHEIPLPAFDRRAGFCLVFEAPDVMRRVRDYPPDWFELPDDELYALSLRR